MSTIYNYEPPTYGKVLLYTTVGDIEIELWSKEAPKACRNFVQLCLEGFYNDIIFHRVIKGFIVQSGDPTGTGAGGDSIYNGSFKDEFHQRLKFSHRGLVACANSGVPNSNNSQFFITLNSNPELNNKHTIFGSVVSNTMYNVLKMEELELDPNDRPYYPPKILKAEVTENPFSDIVPRDHKISSLDQKPLRSSNENRNDIFKHVSAIKNNSLLSFGDEDQEEECFVPIKKKMVSIHDAVDDPKLSKTPAVSVEQLKSFDENDVSDNTTQLKSHNFSSELSESNRESEEKSTKRTAKIDEYKEEQEKLKRDMNRTLNEISRRKLERAGEEIRKEADKALIESMNDSAVDDTDKKKSAFIVETVDEFISKNDRLRRYQRAIAVAPKGTTERQDQTLKLLKKFEYKIQEAAQTTFKPHESDQVSLLEDVDDPGWLSHSLTFEETKFESHTKTFTRENVDSYDIHDPRNPINLRRREAYKPPTK